MCWKVTADDKRGEVTITYDLDWLYKVMQASADSMVPFLYFSAPPKGKLGQDKDRSYPRSSNTKVQFSLLDGPSDDSPSAGGRKHYDGGNLGAVYALGELLGKGLKDLSIPLADVVITAKRALVAAVVAEGKAYKKFEIAGGTALAEERTPGWPVYGYPMLCILQIEQGGQRPDNHARWRVVQCVFGAMLTRLIREQQVGFEAVSRQGFGGVFPALADLGCGARLDPGLLPVKGGKEAVLAALKFTDDCLVEIDKIQNAISQHKDRLEGMDTKTLTAVDHLMSQLLARTLAPKMPTAKEIADFVNKFDGKRSETVYEFKNHKISFTLPCAVKEGKYTGKRIQVDEDDGYGSESDYEDEDDVFPVKVTSKIEKIDKNEKIDGDDDVQLGKGLTVKKISVLSGMAGLRLATFYGMTYSSALFTARELPQTSKRKHPLTWASYFELDPEDLSKAHKNAPNMRILVCDGAPNPLNIPADPFAVAPQELGAIVIDTTNNTSYEKAQYIALLRPLLLKPAAEGLAGGVLLMVDSASKHPTGGDLVHGVVRVCGHKASVAAFFEMTLKKHLTFGQNMAYASTVLSGPETAVRRQLIAERLIMRNADLRGVFRPAAGAFVKLAPSTKGKHPEKTLPKTSVKIVTGTTLKLEEKSLVLVPNEGTLAHREYDYEEDDIFVLLRYALRKRTDVAVLRGTDSHTWNGMTDRAYTAEFQPTITPTTTTFVQPYHVHGNHWALLYFTFQQGRPPHVLYVDPLYPGELPVELDRLKVPFPQITFTVCADRYQDDSGGSPFVAQHSCGAWVVYLAMMKLRDGVLPRPSSNPKAKAMELRKLHQNVIGAARQLPAPELETELKSESK